ncbi:MAG: TonB-dependent receptor, partial [Campylobacteraceae bacterium]|nr:TonB-dependent receptor [Campylobacteraceae bacterium]
LIDIYDIEKIEIVKGAQSGIWGADADAGVVNVITKKAKKGVSANSNIEFGSNSWQKYSGGFGYANNIFDITFNGGYLKTKGISAAAPTKNSNEYGIRAEDLGWERDGFESATLQVKSGVNITDKDRLEFFIRNNKSKTHFDGGAGVDEEDYGSWGEYFNTIRTNFYSLGYIGEYEKNRINIKANHSAFKRSFYGGYAGKVYEIYASDEFNYINSDKLVFGAGYLKDEVKRSAGVVLPYDWQDNKYLFLSNSNEFGDIIFSQSLRYDNYNRFDDKLTGKIGLRYNFYNDMYVLASYKTGYKTPTLYQQTYGDTENLDAEKTDGYEITLGNQNFDITYFDVNVKDAIEYGGWWPNDYYYNLNGKSKFKGVEVSARADLFEELLAEVTYTYLNAKDSSGNYIIRRPKNKIDTSLLWFVNNNVNMNLRTSYIGERYDINDVQTGRYFLSDYIINYKSDKNIDFYLKIDNLFDKYYQEYDGYGTYGRSFYFGVRAGF